MKFPKTKNKYLVIGGIGLAIIGAAWLFPRLMRTITQQLPSQEAVEVPIVPITGGERLIEQTPPALIAPEEDAVDVLRLSNVYRAQSGVGVSPRHNKVLI